MLRFKKHLFTAAIPLLLLCNCVSSKVEIADQLNLNNRADLMFVQLNVNGKKGTFLVDTGASLSLIDHTQAKQFGFIYIQGSNFGKIQGLGGTEQLRLASGIEVIHAQKELKGLKFYAANLNTINNHLDQFGFSILGIVGSDFLKKNDAVINYQDNTITLSLK